MSDGNSPSRAHDPEQDPFAFTDPGKEARQKATEIRRRKDDVFSRWLKGKMVQVLFYVMLTPCCLLRYLAVGPPQLSRRGS